MKKLLIAILLLCTQFYVYATSEVVTFNFESGLGATGAGSTTAKTTGNDVTLTSSWTGTNTFLTKTVPIVDGNCNKYVSVAITSKTTGTTASITKVKYYLGYSSTFSSKVFSICDWTATPGSFALPDKKASTTTVSGHSESGSMAITNDTKNTMSVINFERSTTAGTQAAAFYRKTGYINTDGGTNNGVQYGNSQTVYVTKVEVTVSYTTSGGCIAPTFGTNITEGTDTYCQNASATALTVASDGATFQWQKSTTSASTGFSDIDDATSASYTPLTTSTGTAHYRCVATKSECSANSNVRTVTVNANPTISSNVTTGTDNYCNGDGATALSVTSASATFQWQKSTTSASTGFSDIDDATSASYTPLTTSNGTAYYKCVVTKSGCSTDSNVRTVVVKASPGLSISLKP